MVQVGEYVAYLDGRHIVSRSGDGRPTVIVDLGDVVYVSEGDRTGHGRHILHRGNVWLDSSGKTYIWAGDQLSCSDGRYWGRVASLDDAEIIVKADFPS